MCGCGCCDPCWQCGIRPSSINIQGAISATVPIHTFKRRFESEFDGSTAIGWDDPPPSLFGFPRRVGKGFGPVANLPFQGDEFYPPVPLNPQPPGYASGGRLVFPCVANYYETGGFIRLESLVDEVEVDVGFGATRTETFRFWFDFLTLSVGVLVGYYIGSDGLWKRDRASRGDGNTGSRRLSVIVQEVYRQTHLVDSFDVYINPSPGQWFGGYKNLTIDTNTAVGAVVRTEVHHVDLPKPCRETSGTVSLDQASRTPYLVPPSLGAATPSALYLAGQRSTAPEFNDIFNDSNRLTISANF